MIIIVSVLEDRTHFIIGSCTVLHFQQTHSVSLQQINLQQIQPTMFAKRYQINISTLASGTTATTITIPRPRSSSSLRERPLCASGVYSRRSTAKNEHPTFNIQQPISNGSQKSAVSAQKSEPLTSDLCPLLRVLCPLSSVLRL